MLMTREGEVTDTLPAIPFGRNQWAISDPDAPGRGGMYMRQPYADGPLWAYVPVERALLVLDREAPQSTEGANYQLTKLSFSGDTIFARAYAFSPIPVLGSEVDSILDATAARISESGFLGGLAEGRAREWAELGLYGPAFQPPISHMVLGRNGEIWLREHSLGPAASWLVMDRDGEPLGRVTLPLGMTVLMTDDFNVWGWETDELDVPYLLRYRVGRS